MSAKKSETLPAPSALAPTRPWHSLLRTNWPLLLILILLYPLQYLVEDAGLIDRYSQRLVMLVGINITLAVSLQLINGISGQFSLGHAGFMAVGAYLAAYPAKTFSPNLQAPFAIAWFYLVLGLVLAIAAALLLALFTLIRQSRRLHPALPSLLILATLVWAIADFSASARFDITPPYLLWSYTINSLTSTFNTLLTHGQSFTITTSHLIPTTFRPSITFIILLIGGGTFAALAGLIIGIPTLRLKGDYLAIATLGFAEIIGVLITNSKPLGGALGMSQIPRYTTFAWIYGIALITVIVVWRLVHSARGRAILAVREDEIAASAIGINPTRSKVLAFIVGAFLAGMAGVLFAHYESYITPQHFNFMRSIELVVMVTLAGSGSITGTILAAIVLTYLPEQLRQFSQWRMIIYSLLLITLMLLRPTGLLGNRELWWTRKRVTEGNMEGTTDEHE